jgi:predicted small metal-binding protein
MGKVIECHKVNPTSDCDHVVRGRDESEVMRNAAEHAREHGLEPTPELMAQVRAQMEDETEIA